MLLGQAALFYAINPVFHCGYLTEQIRPELHVDIAGVAVEGLVHRIRFITVAAEFEGLYRYSGGYHHSSYQHLVHSAQDCALQGGLTEFYSGN